MCGRYNLIADADEAVRPLHERMPVILHPDDYGTWLDPEQHDPAVLQLRVAALSVEVAELLPGEPESGESAKP